MALTCSPVASCNIRLSFLGPVHLLAGHQTKMMHLSLRFIPFNSIKIKITTIRAQEALHNTKSNAIRTPEDGAYTPIPRM